MKEQELAELVRTVGLRLVICWAEHHPGTSELLQGRSARAATEVYQQVGREISQKGIKARAPTLRVSTAIGGKEYVLMRLVNDVNCGSAPDGPIESKWRRGAGGLFLWITSSPSERPGVLSGDASGAILTCGCGDS